jgi:hypothetical protein
MHISFFILILLASLVPIAHGASYNKKKQDADYVKEWCDRNRGKAEKEIDGTRKRPDCTTKSHVVEIDYADKWKKNIPQAMEYGKLSGKQAKLVMVVESEEEERKYFEPAKKYADEKSPTLEIDILRNFKSKEASLKEIVGPPVKKSDSGICHEKGKGYYGKTKKFTPYNSMDDCLKSKGRLPKR